MELLDALNYSLRSTGESKVASIDTAHRRTQSILDSITKAQRRLQRRGWWFNTAKVVLQLASGGAIDGRVIVPDDVQHAKPVQRQLNLFPKKDGTNGTFLWDPTVQDWYVGKTVECYIRVQIDDFESLPDSFADYVAVSAALDFTSSYDADATTIQKISADLKSALTEVNREHVQYAAMNFFAYGSTGRVLTQNWGRRYGRYTNG